MLAIFPKGYGISSYNPRPKCWHDFEVTEPEIANQRYYS